MHPGFFGWWKHRHGCGPSGACEHAGPFGEGFGPPGRHGHHHGHGGDEHHASHHFGEDGGGPFGVRRPLRFLAHKLELEEDQVAKLAAILGDLRTERAQAAVDQRRSIASLADAVSADGFDEAKAREAGETRVKSAEKLRDAVVGALGKIHAVLDAEQRRKLAYLLRTGTLEI